MQDHPFMDLSRDIKNKRPPITYNVDVKKETKDWTIEEVVNWVKSDPQISQF